MLSSLARYLEHLPEEEGDPFLTQIHALFQSDFIPKQQTCDQDEGEPLHFPTRPVDSDDMRRDQDTGGPAGPPAQPEHLEMQSSTVLHLGSVLSTEHDYLL